MCSRSRAAPNCEPSPAAQGCPCSAACPRSGQPRSSSSSRSQGGVGICVAAARSPSVPAGPQKAGAGATLSALLAARAARSRGHMQGASGTVYRATYDPSLALSGRDDADGDDLGLSVVRSTCTVAVKKMKVRFTSWRDHACADHLSAASDIPDHQHEDTGE
jgi:hypothetical protein